MREQYRSLLNIIRPASDTNLRIHLSEFDFTDVISHYLPVLCRRCDIATGQEKLGRRGVVLPVSFIADWMDAQEGGVSWSMSLEAVLSEHNLGIVSGSL